MKKISIALIFCLIIGVVPFSAFAETVTTNGVTEEGVVTYVNDFESYESNATYVNDTEGIHYYNGGSNVGKYVIRGNNTKYLELQNTTASKYPDLRINFYKTDAAPKMNALADAKTFKVKFRMRFIPTTAGKSLQMFLGGFWNFYVSSSGKTYTIQCNGGNVAAVEEAKTNYTVTPDTADNTNNKFLNYEIDVDREKNMASLKIDGETIFENVPQYNDNTFDSLYLKYNAMTGSTAIDDIKVIITDPAVCSNASWAEDTDIDFEDFGVGVIPASETENVGGFTNTHTDDKDFYAFIDYTYDSETPDTINKYLKITKNSKGNGARSVKRDISAAVSNYSVYELSFKVKNDLEDVSSVAILKDGDGSKEAGGTAIRFTKSGAASYFDYSLANPQVDLEGQTLFAPGEWTQVKFKVYKNENKADIYIGDMETPVAEGVTTKHAYGGRSLVSSPQNQATGSVSVDDITITPVEDDNYVFTYSAGSTDMSRYTSGTVTAECKVAESVAKPPIIIAAEYNASGELDRVAISGEMDENRTVRAELSGVTAATGKRIKIMIWDGMDTLMPLRKNITLVPEITATE